MNLIYCERCFGRDNGVPFASEKLCVAKKMILFLLIGFFNFALKFAQALRREAICSFIHLESSKSLINITQ